ncbi:MAG: HEAT repeat domain-containing protein [Candidatus Aminicenantes bacterium]|nr:HEAT repeat domain-containing protein [Candidatus Aminicenantes bacterium]
MKNQRTHHGSFGKSITGIALAVALGLGMLAPAGAAQQRPQAEFALTYDSLDAILRDLANYKFDQGVGAPLGLRAYVFSHKDDPRARRETEAALLRFIQGSPAPGGLMAACRALRLIGGPDSAPVLAALVLKPETTDAARYALERIPGREADQALLAALDKVQGEVKRGIIFSIGERKSAAAVPAFERLAGGKDLSLAADAVKALGKVGGPDAVRALTAVLGKAGPQLKLEAASALLLAAEDDPGAAAIYDKLLAANLPPVMRQAAFKGKIEAAGGGGKELVLKTLAGKDVVLFAPAIAMVPRSFKAQEIGPAADLLSRLPEGSRIQLAAVLGGYPADAVGPYLLTAAEDPSLVVRLAALRAIGKSGGAKSIALLATKAARTSGAEQDAAREALVLLQGPDVDPAILAHFGQASDDAVKAELVRAAGARRIAGAKPALMAMVKSASPMLKAKAAAALGDIAGPEDVPDLLGLLLGLEDETARESMRDTVAAVARANPRELSRAATVKAFLAAENDPKKKVDLLRVLGKIGDDSSLALIRAALSDKNEGVVDAAVRALADWPSGMARDDVYEVARSSFALHHRVLSVRAFVRMIGLEPFRAPDGAVADLLRALAVAPRPEEKKLVLGMLVRFPCVAGLKTAESLLADPTVAGEAKLAADRIRQALGRRTP